MEFDESYIDRPIKVKSSIERLPNLNENNDTLTLSISSSSHPTTSINLDQTLFQSRLQQPSQSLSQSNSAHVYNDIETISSSVPSILTRDNNFYNELASITTSNNINSWKRSFVSNEIPNVFKPFSDEFLTTSNSSSNNDDISNYDKNFLFLTSAGKPIYSTFGKDEQLVSIMGLINTIIHFFRINASKELKTIKFLNSNFVFLNRSPIILLAYSRLGETTTELIDQLDFLYSYLISSISERQILRLFDKRDNFDLRNFLEVSDFENLDQICYMISNKFYPDLYLGSLQCLTLKHSSIRKKTHELMIKNLLMDSDLPRGTLLYGLLVYPENKLVSVLRPKGHTLHTTDLHLLLCLIFNRFNNQDNNQELWVPICFPKFNANGFLYAYINFLSSKNNKPSSRGTSSASNIKNSNNDKNCPALVLISAQKDMFHPLKVLAESFINELTESGLLDKITTYNGFKMSDVPAPFVHHFIYKSKKHVQYITPEVDHNMFINQMPNFEISYASYELKLKTYYQQLYNSIMNGSTGGPLSKSILNFMQWSISPESHQEPDISEDMQNSFLKEESPNIMGLAWVTPTFELYLICNNGIVDKDVIFKSAKNIANWCRKNEARLFVTEGAVY
ncbi:hypothetical protein Kpol_223p2 [Vanderwaltozyma polyspora DSM 70294]|uniref:Vacuolar fusion protein MON1 n=1 Tax=Vanderwaltozyma polyspora (strain ATCC 22028 / DSM 70294 / BCRC 21397 / CBS 2163 / NBRC 10782 / NRRL Y-8283 / UCD 57-17) TaxID=436907 RepID=A7TTE5_VANPO|nr:uncharacterized protein Kpol_223p2 [Vanderwaltozyma polyspora DSM 70294]EDO14459.1 hypothetical protein Kpol_223p2 [Vanderwaltozyma polyspora DSM 70294]